MAMQFIQKHSHDGKLLMQIGERGVVGASDGTNLIDSQGIYGLSFVNVYGLRTANSDPLMEIGMMAPKIDGAPLTLRAPL